MIINTDSQYIIRLEKYGSHSHVAVFSTLLGFDPVATNSRMRTFTYYPQIVGYPVYLFVMNICSTEPQNFP